MPMTNHEIKLSFSIPPTVMCQTCGKAHDKDADTYFTVWGNITVGAWGGLVGNNFNLADELHTNATLKRVSYYCHICLLTYLAEYAQKVHQWGPIK